MRPRGQATAKVRVAESRMRNLPSCPELLLPGLFGVSFSRLTEGYTRENMIFCQQTRKSVFKIIAESLLKPEWMTRQTREERLPEQTLSCQ